MGNYFGAIKLWKELQDDPTNLCIYSIVDLHSISLRHDPVLLKANTKVMIASLLACGIDQEKSICFLQSSMPQHTYLSWILYSLISEGRLSNQPQYKLKSDHLKEVPLSLLSYPVLQSADIMLYKAHKVPVGEDQTPHMFIARDLAEKFNRIYGETFPIPEKLVAPNKFAARVKSLRYPEMKMSKSEPSIKGRIDIFDEPEVVTERIKKAVSDGIGRITYDPDKRPGVSNLISIHSLCTGQTYEEICNEYHSLSTGQYKLKLAEIVVEFCKPFRLKYLEFLKDDAYLYQTMSKGKLKAAEIADETLREVSNRLGLHYS